VYTNIESDRKGSRVTIRFRNHPATIAGVTLFGTIYLLLWLLVIIDVIRTGDLVAGLRGNAIGAFLLLLIGLPLFGPYFVLKFVAREDPPRLLHFFTEILHVREANHKALKEN
jgi:hypothetical protein